MFYFNEKAAKLRKARRELNAMTDRELSDLGIARAEIPAVLRGEINRSVEL